MYPRTRLQRTKRARSVATQIRRLIKPNRITNGQNEQLEDLLLVLIADLVTTADGKESSLLSALRNVDYYFKRRTHDQFDNMCDDDFDTWTAVQKVLKGRV